MLSSFPKKFFETNVERLIFNDGLIELANWMLPSVASVRHYIYRDNLKTFKFIYANILQYMVYWDIGLSETPSSQPFRIITPLVHCKYYLEIRRIRFNNAFFFPKKVFWNKCWEVEVDIQWWIDWIGELDAPFGRIGPPLSLPGPFKDL